MKTAIFVLAALVAVINAAPSTDETGQVQPQPFGEQLTNDPAAFGANAKWPDFKTAPVQDSPSSIVGRVVGFVQSIASSIGNFVSSFIRAPRAPPSNAIYNNLQSPAFPADTKPVQTPTPPRTPEIAPVAIPTIPAAIPTTPVALPSTPAAVPTTPVSIPTTPVALPNPPQ